MKRAFRNIMVLAVATTAAHLQADGFRPGQLAVLRIGDGDSDLRVRQSQVFIDQFDPAAADQAGPSFTVAIPCKGTNSIWMNGHAGTEGGLARSGDRSVLTVTGYCGDILSLPGTPSKLAYDRGICVVDATGGTRLAYRGNKWYGLFGDKTNPRGVVTDGTNNFWGCGNGFGALYFNGETGVRNFGGFTSVRAIRIIHDTLYVSIAGSDASDDSPAGIYGFADASGAAQALPSAAHTQMKVSVPSPQPYTHTAGFDVSPKGDVAYMADAVYGIVKFTKQNGAWQLASYIYIPGYGGAGTGILTNSASTAVHAGCFGLVADFSQPHPVLFATTTEWSGFGGVNVNSNRLVRIEDTSSATGGVTVTNAGRTLAFSGSTKTCFRGVDFTPEPRRLSASR
jgi:hypothetical protein